MSFLTFTKYELPKVRNKVSEPRRGVCNFCLSSDVISASVNIKYLY